MTPRRMLFLFVILFVTALTLWPDRNTFTPVADAVKPASLPNILATESAKSQQTLILANTDGSFSTQHREPSRDPNSRWTNPAKPVEVVFPRRFSDPVTVQSGGTEAQCLPLAANPNSHSELIDGALIYRDAFPGCDVKYKSSTYKTEEFIVVKDKSALNPSGKASWTWDIQSHYHGTPLTPRLTPMHTIELVDANNIPRLRIDTPFGKDSAGTAVVANEHLRFHLDGSRLTLELNASNLQTPIEIDPSWSSTGTMSVIRYLHTATITSNGNVVVVGGSINSSLPNSSCEVYTPSTGTWSATDSLTTARSAHSAIRLADGRILVAGGQNSAQAIINSCEIYDPSTGHWSATGSLASVRQFFTLSSLPNGRILAAGGSGNPSYVSACELFDASANGGSGAWSATGSLANARGSHTANTLADGSILIAGGQGIFSSTPSEVFDPNTLMWSPTGILQITRAFHASIVLSNGKTLVAGGDGNPSLNSCELYEPLSQTWNTTGTLGLARYGFPLSSLQNGLILASGGIQFGPSNLSSCEVFNPATSTWMPTKGLAESRGFHTATVLDNGKVLVTGGIGRNTCEVFDPRPVSSSFSVSVGAGSSVPITLSAESIALSPVNFNIVSAGVGALSGNVPSFVYTPPANFVGTDTLTYKSTDSFGDSAVTSVTINVLATPPDFTSGPTASPNPAQPNQLVQFSAAASDVGSHANALIWLWNFGDGTNTTGENPSHAFTGTGDFSVSATVTDPAGTSTTATVLVHVGNAPIARFTTGDVVGFVGAPFTFDATLSTDPENAIASYSWNFGDDSPLGSGQVTSKIYDAAGTYTATLTLLDAEGLSATTQRLIEILPADQIGVFNAFVEFKTSFDRTRTAKDSLTLKARLNIGDTQLADGSTVALEIAGQRFAATLDRKLRAAVKVAPKQTWKIQFATRKQSAGQVDIQVTIKNADLGLGFNQLGAVAGGDGSASISVPVRLELGPNAVEIPCDTDFDFNNAGTKAKGEGVSD